MVDVSIKESHTKSTGNLPTINDFKEEDRIKIASEIRLMNDEYRTASKEQYDLFLRCLRAYKSKLVGNAGKIDIINDSKHEWPSSYKAIETLYPQIMSLVFPHNAEHFSTSPVSENDRGKEQIVKKVLDYFIQDINFKQTFGRVIKQSLIFGSSYAKIGWERTTRPQREIRKVDITSVNAQGQEEIIGQRAEVVHKQFAVVSKPKIEVISVFDMACDPYAPSFEDANCIHRYYTSYDTLLQHSKVFKIYKDIAKLKNDNIRAIRTSESDTDSEWQTAMELSGVDPTGVGTVDNIEVLEFYGNLIYKGKTYYDYIAKVANGILIDFRPNPYIEYGSKPFIHLGLIPDILSYIADKGILSGILDLQELMTIINRLRINCEMRNVYGVYGTTFSSGVTPANFKPGPCSLTSMEQPGDVFSIRDNTNYNVSFTEQQNIAMEIEEITSATKTAMGSETRKSTTATENKLMSEALTLKSSEYAENIGIAHKRALEMIWLCFKMFGDKDVPIRLTENGQDSQQLVSAAMLSQLHMDINILSIGNIVKRLDQLERLVYIFQMVTGNPITVDMISKGILDVKPILQYILQYSNIQDYEKILLEEPSITLEQATEMLLMSLGDQKLIATFHQTPPEKRIDLVANLIQNVISNPAQGPQGPQQVQPR